MKTFYYSTLLLILVAFPWALHAQKDGASVKTHPETGVYSLQDKLGKKGIAIEDIAKRDEFSKTFQYSDGTYTRQASTIPMHYKDGVGNWLSYSLGMKRTGDVYSYDGPHKSQIKISSGLLSITNDASTTLSYGVVQKLQYPTVTGEISKFSTPTLNGFVIDKEKNELTYKNFWPGIDRNSHFENGYIKTNYILNNKLNNLSQEGYTQLEESYDLPIGASVIKSDGEEGIKGFKGDLIVVDAKGKELFVLWKAVIFDSKEDGRKEIEGEYTFKIVNQKLILTLWIPNSFLHNEAVQYPIVIDPTASYYAGSTTYFRGAYGFSTSCMSYDYINHPASTITGWRCDSYCYSGYYTGYKYVRVSYNQNWQNQYTHYVGGYGWFWSNTQTYTTANQNWGGGNLLFNLQGYNSSIYSSSCSTSRGYRSYSYYYIDYTQQPADPSAANANVNPICSSNQTITLTASNPIGTVYWYTGGCGTTFIGTGTSINVTPNTTTTYYCRNYSNGQFSNGCASTTVTVASPPAAPTASNATINCGQTATLNASGSGSLIWFSNSNATGQLGTGTSYTTGALSGNTTVYVTANNSGCNSSATSVNITVNSATTPTTNNASVNCGQTATLTASSNSPLYWYSNSNGTGLLGTGTSYTTGTVNATTTVYVQAGTGACASQIIPVTASPNVQQPSASNVSANCGQTASLSASGANFYYWYSDAAGTTQVGTGSSYTTPALNANTTYYVGGSSAAPQSLTQTYSITSTGQLINMGSSCGTGSYYNGCNSGQSGFNWTDNLPAGTQISSVQIQLSLGVVCTSGALQTYMNNNAGGTITPNYHCSCSGSNNGIFTLTYPANQYVVGGNNQFRINANNCFGLFNGNSALSGQFARVTVTYSSAACVSPLVPVVVSINQATAPTASNQSIGCQSTATFTASANSNITWYSNSNGTGQLGTGNTYTTPALGSTTTYYMQAGTGACASQIIPVTATVNAATNPVSSGASINCGQTAALTATSNSPITWYANSNGTGQLGTGTTFTTPTLTSNTTYYAQAGSGGCVSQLVAVPVTVNTNISAPTASNLTIGCGQTAALTASGATAPYTYMWYSNASGTTQIGSGANFTSPALTSNTTYYVSQGTPGSGTQTFNYTGSVQTFTAPLTGTYTLDLYGAQGGTTSQYTGGLGGRAQGTLNLTAGQTINIYVGEQPSSATGGWNGGGNSGGNGRGGGGASDIRVGGTALTNRVVVASGGGAGGLNSQGFTGSVGAAGGGTTGNTSSQSSGGWSSGSGGTQSSGGASSGCCGNGTAGTLGIGGNGANGSSGCGSYTDGWGGGGGGGYYGGGGGGNCGGGVGGGGGSSFIGGINSGSTTAGVRSGHGQVTISWTGTGCSSSVVPVMVTVNAATTPTITSATVNCGQTATLSASSNGSLTWYTNSNGTGQVGTGSSFTTPTLNATTTYYVQAGTGGCASQIIPVTATISMAAPNVSNATIGCGQSTVLAANGGTNYTWYSDAQGTTQIGTGASYTTPSLTGTSTYYVQNWTGNPTTQFYINTLSNAGSFVTDHNSWTGDDRGGIAITQQYYYYVGDNNTVRYNMPGLTNPVSLTRRDGIFSDLSGAGTLYTLWNSSSNTEPQGTCTSFTVNAVRTLNADCSHGSTTIPTSQSFTMGNCNNSAVFSGHGCVILYTGTGGSPANTYFKISLPSGTVTNLGTYTLNATGSENWARWGVAEFDGTNHRVVYVNSSSINRLNLATGAVSTVQSFSNLSDMACFTYSPWDNRWYFHYEGGSQFGGSSETAGYANGTHVYNAANLCQSSLTPVTVTVNAATTPTVNGASINCGQTAALTASSNGAITWYANSNGTGQIATGTNYTTAALTSSTTYYVQAGTGACASQIVAVPITVNTNIAAPTAAAATINCGNTATLTASGLVSPNTYMWYSNAAGTNLLGTSTSFTTPVLTGTTTYYLAQGSPGNGSQTFNYTGSVQTFVAPVSGTYTLDLYGAQGGTTSQYNGGQGGRAQGTISLTAGQAINIYVGEQPSSPTGGWNGGGNSGGNGRGGGGASDIRVGGTGLNNRVIVASGGGGGGLNSQGFTGSAGAAGGGTTGNTSSQSSGGWSSGSGGTQSAGGASSGCCGNGTAGSLGIGGNGANGSSGCGSYTDGWGGGGGGGYYGGGGGSNCGGGVGGGGGSSFTGGVNSGTTTAGVRSGHGQVTITWTGTGCSSSIVAIPVTVNPLASPTVNNPSISCGTTAALTATGGGGQATTWYSNANGTGQIGTGSSYTTPTLTNSTTYYVVSENTPTAVATYTFTNCGASGSNGPNQTQVNNTYASSSLSGAVTSSNGIQLWTVPQTGTYVIDARGAMGGTYPGRTQGGNGARMVGTFNLTAGQQLKIIVGQEGYYGGGGGGSFVATNANVPLIVAGGGGGGGSACGGNPPHAGTSTSGSNNFSPCTGSFYSGGSNGSGGNGPGGNGGPGGGFNTNGSPNDGNAGQAFVNGGYGSAVGWYGGFGGGGGTTDDQGAGGGGYSGGAGDQEDGNGGGGGSYNNGSNQSNTAGFQSGMGQVIITRMSSPCSSNVVPVQVTVNPMTSPTVGGTTSLCSSTNTTLTASGSNGSYVWYSNSNGTGQIGTGATYTTPTLNSNTTYYVQASANGCSSTLVPVAITVNASPTAPTASNPTICSGQTTTITASANANWYTVPTGGQSIGQAQAYTTAALNNTVTYYMEGVNGPCVSPTRTAVTVTVNATPTSNSGASIVDASTCGKQSVNIGGNTLAGGQAGLWSVLSAANNAGNPGLFSLSGTSANCSFTGAYGGTYVLQWQVTDQSTGCAGVDTMVVTFHQPNDASIAGMITSGDLLWCGLTGTDWSTSTNWYQKQGTGYYVRMSGNVQPSITNEVFTVSMANGGMCIGNNNPTLSVSSSAEDVYVGPGITWNLSNDSINIAQNLTNNGTIIASTGVVNFTNNTNSVISGSGSTQLFNMRINKSGGATVTLQQPVLVTNNLNMVQGNVYTTNTNLLTLGVSSTTPGSLTYNTGTVVGPLRRYFANSATSGTGGLFPVGTATYNRYADFSFGSGPGVNQFLTVEYKPGAPMQGGIALYNGLPLVATNSLIQNYSADGYWEVEPTSGNYTSPITTVPYGVTLFANNLTGMTTPQICRIIKSAGSNNAGQHHVAWQACGTHTPINAQASPQSFLITSTGTQGFSWFNIGTPNSQALPVELLSFSGDCNEGQVTLSWQTATEHNSDYYEVEKSRDGMNWQVLTTVEAAGNSTQLLNYGTTDAHAMEGNNYYRLTQVDIDGSSKTYDVINVSCSGTSKGYFTAYPNPSTGTFQVILNDKQMVGTGQLRVKDTKGSELLNRTIEVKPGINMFSVTDLNLAPGVYYIQIVQGDRATEVLKEVIR